MKHVLMVSYAFARDAGVSAQRSRGFARHLPDCGWQPIVLTADRHATQGDQSVAGAHIALATNPVGAPPRFVSPGGSAEHGRRQLPSSLRRWVRTFVLIPDEAVAWLPAAVATGLKIARESGIDAVYSTSGPPTAHLVALALHRLTGCPWVADFRDPWTAVPNVVRREMYRSPSRRRVDGALEARVLGAADRVVTVSDAQRRLMRGLAPSVEPERFHVITNGYEPDTVRRGEAARTEALTITYTGRFYRAGECPDPVFQAVRGLLASRAISAADIRIVVTGPSSARVLDAARRFGIADVVDARGSVGHDAALQLQRDASVLWLALSEAHGAQGALSAKVFEYMAARRPVLAVVPSDSAPADLVRETGIGVVADPRDLTAIQRSILAWSDEHRQTGTVAWSGRPAALAPYSRARLTGALAALFDEVTGA